MSKTVGIAGLGAIGRRVAEALDARIDGLTLVAVSARDAAKAEKTVSAFSTPVAIVPPGELAAMADVIVECLPPDRFDDVAVPAVEAGRIFMPLSISALLERSALVDRATQTGARIIVPSGAILGLDAIKAMAEGTLTSVIHVTRKPPGSLAGAPYLEQNNISIEGLSEPLLIFKGSVLEGAKHFPKNVNVSVAVSLAGLGPEKTMLEVWADPSLERNTHKVVAESDIARISMEIEGMPAPDNPRTGLITPYSVIATLRGLVSTLRVGT